ncbi:MAG TPA: fatty acid-binding protein DegV, partial [Arthrobacter sp.]|nr:fatty acid-binding protein DegV [Arthrobacter sp.]
EKVRSVPRAVARLEELALDEFEQRDPQVRQWAVHHFGNRQLAQELSMRLRLRSGEGPIPQLTALPAVLAAHAGLGALVVVVSGGRREATPPPHGGSEGAKPT